MDDDHDDLSHHLDDVGLFEPGYHDERQKALLKFQHYVNSSTNEIWQIGKWGLSTLRLVLSEPEAVASALDIVSTAVEDNDKAVRCEIMEYVPHMALLLSEDVSNEPLRALISSHLLPAVIKVLADPDPQVLGMAESAFLTILEHCLIQDEDVEHRVWPVIEGRLKSPNMENRLMSSFQDNLFETHNRVISMMSKIAPWVASNITERLFVPLLVQLSANPEFMIRRACSTIFGEICTVVGTKVTESKLLPTFLRLCCDRISDIRKICAEVILSVSFVCTLETRKTKLAPVFGALLSDSMRWVQMAAFQSLGPFITTFAEPSITVLGYNTQGELVLKHPDGFEFKVQSNKIEGSIMHLDLTPDERLELCQLIDDREEYTDIYGAPEEEEEEEEEDDEEDTNKEGKEGEGHLKSSWERVRLRRQQVKSSKATEKGDGGNEGEGGGGGKPTRRELRLELSSSETNNEDQQPLLLNGEVEPADEYNQFNYWREPLPVIDLNKELPKNVRIVRKSNSRLHTRRIEEEVELILMLKNWGKSKEEIMGSNNKNSSETEGSEEEDRTLKGGRRSQGGRSQDIVPEELINHFVSMTVVQQDRSAELAHHCAYNLPAVALTLGPENWPFLKEAYKTLAAARQWKVRRIVASSIHELAVIVGEDVATQDLVPVFNGFIKDVDEVRIGALKHLAHFLKLLRPAGRNSFLPRLAEFLVTDYDWNWRFREELAEQLWQALGLFTPWDTYHHLTPVVMALLLDKAAEVRKTALCLVTELVNHISINVTLLRDLLAQLAEQFAHSSRWNRRQTFALLCSRLITEHVLSDEMFGREVLMHLIDLSWDPVPNVKLSVARTLASDVMANQYFADPKSPYHELLVPNLERLQGDKDRDVRYFASLPPSDSSSPQLQSLRLRLKRSSRPRLLAIMK